VPTSANLLGVPYRTFSELEESADSSASRSGDRPHPQDPPPPAGRCRQVELGARTQTTNQLKSLLVTAPPEVRERVQDLKTPVLVQACARLRSSGPLSDPAQALKVALRRLARRYQHLTGEIKDADTELHDLVATAAPGMTNLLGVGVEVTGQLLTTVGDNPTRMRSEAAFAHLCGVAPIPASSGKTRRHRLNRGGDRAANNALYTVVLTRLLAATLDEDEDDGLGEHAGAWCAGPGRAVVVTMALRWARGRGGRWAAPSALTTFPQLTPPIRPTVCS